MRMTLKQVNSALLRAISARITSAPTAGSDETTTTSVQFVVESLTSEPWASLTFKGERQSLHFRIDGVAEAVRQARARLAADLEDMDLQLAGLFLADAELVDQGCVCHADGRISLSLNLLALTIEE